MYERDRDTREEERERVRTSVFPRPSKSMQTTTISPRLDSPIASAARTLSLLGS